jgi:CheY-like chemotaxis protein
MIVENERTAWYEFAISDTGIGIPKDRVDALFSPFVQADESTTRKYGGTGLGLAISKQLVEMMGGSIRLETEEGRGSTFRFTAEFEKQRKAPSAGAGRCAQPGGLKALVVDDSAANRQVVSTLLTFWGYRSSEAANSADAMELLSRAAREGDPFAIALVDKDMPDADGEEVARRIAADPLLPGTTLLLMTPLGEQGPSMNTGATASIPCVPKPIIEGRLREALTAALRRTLIPEPVPAIRAPATAEAGLTAQRPRILLAEDNFINREVFLAMLGQRGLDADAVLDGAEAVKALQTTSYDLVFMDCEMPELDGYEATRRIRRPETGTLNPQVPIVAVTANAMPGDCEKCLQCGMSDYLAKPIEPEELLQALLKWLPGAATLIAQNTELTGAGRSL